MNLYNYIFSIALIFTFLHKSATDTNTALIYPDCGVIAPSPSTIGLVFFIKVNNTSDRNDYSVEITPDECCLEEDEVDCDSVRIIGGCTDFVPKGEMRTIKVIAPLLNQYERKGYCTVFVDSKSNNSQNKRDIIKVNFDTTFKETIDTLENYMHCEHKDEDPFNNCKPVNCDVYYNGNKPYYSRKVKRCVAVPPCFKEDDYDYPSVIYNPQTNQCIEESIVNEDLEYIKTSFKDKSKKRQSKDILIINKYHPNTTTFVDNDFVIDDVGKTTKSQQEEAKYTSAADVSWNPTMKSIAEVNGFRHFIKKYFIDNKCALIVLVLVIIVQCVLICTMLYCLSKTCCCCCEEKKVIRKFFNYRHDASVTTPLINTSNIETETADYEYLTDSSNKVDQKIKCYKSCQKDKNNAKKSMSDDILSKLLNRRNWKKFPSQVNPNPETSFKEAMAFTPINNEINIPPNVEKRATSETKVVFEDEKTNNIFYNKQPELENTVDNADTFNELKERNETTLSSEKEIKSLSYNHFDSKSPECRDTLAMNTNVFKDGKSKKGNASNSIEKGAQAYFSNDSIDDFLSERGMIYLAGENISKYTFTSGSNDMKPSQTSSGSSKTSKNFVKNVLSLLPKRSKPATCSDPGQNKSIDVELIHISKASVYSSTNDSDYITNLKRKDSRTSF